jgi:hypothetical protein
LQTLFFWLCFALLSSVSGDYENQIYNDGEEKKNQRNPKKISEKVRNSKKERKEPQNKTLHNNIHDLASL